jgi:hypothetical protein
LTSLVNRPRSSACSALTGSASNSNSAALADPTRRCSVHEDPESADSPTLANAIIRLARLVAILKSHAKANAAPAPAAVPGSDAMIGLGIVAMLITIGL